MPEVGQTPVTMDLAEGVDGSKQPEDTPHHLAWHHPGPELGVTPVTLRVSSPSGAQGEGGELEGFLEGSTDGV